MKVMSLVGARPNFIKIGPVLRALAEKRLETFLVHSGQHYDPGMSRFFFRDLNIPEPSVNLNVGSGTHAEQTGKIMIAFEKVCMVEKPDVIVVVGDVNSTLAGALVAAKLQIPLVHVEAGLRSFDRTMPEEINRVLTDALADSLFTTESDAEVNLLKEGIARGKIFFVGNVMIDSLLPIVNRPDMQKSLNDFEYVLVTLHRPESVNDETSFKKLVQVLVALAGKIVVLLPLHPRTRQSLDQLGLYEELKRAPNLRLMEPLGYLDFVRLMKFAKFVITDSGGIQEETTVLGIPCITVRKTTERPVTVSLGTNVVAGLEPSTILMHCENALRGDWKTAGIPPLWDGKASKRIADILCDRYSV